MAATCEAPTTNGKPCSRPVQDGQSCCAWHLARLQKLDQESFYGVLSPGELQVLHVASLLSGLEAEITTLRVMIRHCLTDGDVRQARQCMDSLARLLKAQNELGATQEDALAEALGRVLTTLETELAPIADPS